MAEDHDDIRVSNTGFLPIVSAYAARIGPATLHRLAVKIERRHQYGRGRRKADGTRTLKETRFGLKITVSPDHQAIDRLQGLAGCFVLITNTQAAGKEAISAR